MSTRIIVGLVVALAGAPAWAAWSAGSFQSAGAQTLVLDFGGLGKERVELSQETPRGETTRYYVALYLGETSYRRTRVPEGVFQELHARIFHIYHERKREERSTLHCERGLQIALRTAGKGEVRESLCFDLMADAGHRDLRGWYAAVQTLR